MDLDDINEISAIDSSNLISFIHKIPDDVLTAWQLGRGYGQKPAFELTRVILCGSGTSLITSRILAAYLSKVSNIHVSVVAGDELPAWACDRQSLVFINSLTGNEPELKQLLTQCSGKDSHLIVIAPAGQIQAMTETAGFSFLPVAYSGPSKMTFPYAFFTPLGVLSAMGLVQLPEDEVNDLAIDLKKSCEQIDLTSPITSNPAKRLAGQFMNRLVTLFASGAMVDVAHLWKAQINENAKAWAQVEEINIASRSTVGGMCFPEAHLSQMMTIFLETPFDEAVSLAASGKLRELFMVEGFNTDYYIPSGNSPLKAIWNATVFGLYVSYYLAIAYGIDPLPNPGIEEMEYFLSEL